jgi:hypothetical protein
MNFSLEWVRNLLKPGSSAEQKQSLFEEQKKIIDEAEEFDRLSKTPAWTTLLTYLAEQVNATLVESTKYEGDPSRMMWEVTRWNAKRQLLDDLQARVNSTLEERDRLVAEIKELEENAGYAKPHESN